LRKLRLAVFTALALLASGSAPLFAYNPPAGGLLIPTLATADSSIAGLTVTALDSPWADRLNPAASAAQQRPVLSFGYEALTDFGAAQQGLGTALALGGSLPRPFGVLGAGLRLVSTPGAMTSLPLGTSFTASASIAKALFPNLYVGAGLDLALGSKDGSFGWGAGLDLGFIHIVGKLGPFQDFRWGGVIANIGKGYSTAADAAASTAISSYPAAFTPSFGAEGLVVKSADWKLGLGLGLSFPSFQDLGFELSARLAWKDKASIKTSWGFDIGELVANKAPSLVPNFSISAVIPITMGSQGKDSLLSEHGWDKSEIRPTVVVQPLNGSVLGLGAGFVLPLGVVDKVPPKIEARFIGSEWGPAYLSPNSDGSHDLINIPVTITDKRYLESYELRVYRGSPDEPAVLSGAAAKDLVRVKANKESRPENSDLEGLWKRLTYVQTGLASPGELSWNGRLDSGELAPDGEYAIYLAAKDDNGNSGLAGPFKVVVDNTPPSLSLGLGVSSPIFSPDGDGNKDTIPFNLSGSVEDLWSVRVLDAGGKAIRSLEYRDAAPSNFSWDGKTDTGLIAPDGVYSVLVGSTDRAGNSIQARVDNILVNTQQPPINVAIDLSAFSPNGDGVKDAESIISSVPVKTGIISWRLSVLDRNKVERWARKGTDGQAIPGRLAYDGRDSGGQPLPEGQYQAELAVTYSNGHSPKVFSPFFTIDRSPPAATVAADRAAFNPAGSEGQNLVSFGLTGSREDRWTAQIFSMDGGKPSGAAVRTWSMVDRPDAKIEWDGSDDQGKPLPDGSYGFVLSAVDKAGNSYSSAPLAVLLDTEKKAVRLSTDTRAFSPNGDGVKDTIRIATSVLAKDKLDSYILTIESVDGTPAAGGAGSVQKTWKGRGSELAESYLWDGSGTAGSVVKVPDSRYLARLKVLYTNGDSVETTTAPFVIDTMPPTVTAGASALLFSPNGDGRLDSIEIAQKSSPEDGWTGKILAADGSAVKSWSWKGEAQSFSWDGSDEAGNVVPDGAYRYAVEATDAAGNKGGASIAGIAVDNRPAQVFVTASESGISPNGDGFKDSLNFSPIVNLKDGISSWRLAVTDKSGAERRVFSGKAPVPERVEWDGKDGSGAVVQGEFTGTLTVDYAKGDRASAKTGSILVDSLGPVVKISLSPELFSPDNDGVNDELSFNITVADENPIVDWRLDIAEAAVVEGAPAGAKPQERLFISWGGKGMPAPSITWDGRSAKGELVEAATDYPWYFTIKDSLGNVSKVSGKIPVDVLVIREGERLKVKVPSIVFRPNYADFNGLDAETLERNAKVIRRIAQVLNRFKDYKIRIEGHANSVAKITGASAAAIAEEETKELEPLSTGRAELVRKLLVENGVDASRLTVVGLGSSEPVVDFKDAVNRWKNRRVEFVLIKN
jgi:outer membrane protein OmpA-like peptidoglycan-associated protein/flagellar hook assembly protein FlgD